MNDSAKQMPRTDAFGKVPLDWDNKEAVAIALQTWFKICHELEADLAAATEALARHKRISESGESLGGELEEREARLEAEARIADLERECAETCEDCDHGIRGGKPCESCGGLGKVTFRSLYEATAVHVKELKGRIADLEAKCKDLEMRLSSARREMRAKDKVLQRARGALIEVSPCQHPECQQVQREYVDWAIKHIDAAIPITESTAAQADHAEAISAAQPDEAQRNAAEPSLQELQKRFSDAHAALAARLLGDQRLCVTSPSVVAMSKEKK